MLNKLHTLTTLLLLILILALPALAQEGTQEAPQAANPPLIEDSPVSDAAPLDYGAFSQLSAVVILTYVLVEIAKRTPVLQNYDMFKLSSLVTLVLFVGYQIVILYGGDAMKYLGYLTDVGHFAESAWYLFLSFAGASGMHHTRKNVGTMLSPKP